MTLPGVEGQEGGQWIVINSGKLIVHVLDEEARADYDLESLWTSETSKEEPVRVKVVSEKMVLSWQKRVLLLRSSFLLL
ncbi:protein Iojap-related, mitochondrial-like [Populus nigra]|uniref:protein Iojap-related, mitochondrial-like n=1 Tax=Populus nigra TaxID=3691 RepID=UPI002B27C08C|nr:protein Iojap-related, mitochondrial-like [Populus nigra]